MCRYINVWNSLSARVVDSDSVAMFKRRLSRMDMLVVNFQDFRALIRVFYSICAILGLILIEQINGLIRL